MRHHLLVLLFTIGAAGNLPLPEAWADSMGDDGIHLTCKGCPEAASAALRNVVSAHYAATRPQTPGLSFTLHMTRVERDFVEGYLVWQLGDAPEQKSAPVQISVMDRAIRPDTYEQLVETLLKISKAPVPQTKN